MLRFRDGEQFDTRRGALRVEERRDGLYVVGGGVVVAVDSEEEGWELVRQMGGEVMRHAHVRYRGTDAAYAFGLAVTCSGLKTVLNDECDAAGADVCYLVLEGQEKAFVRLALLVGGVEVNWK